MQNKSKYVKGLLAAILMLGVQPVWAAGPPAPSMFNNPMAVTLILIMLLLLVIIGILATMVTGTAELKMKQKELSQGTLTSIIFLLLMISAPALFAQDVAAADAVPQSKNIAGMAPTTFYIMIAVLFIELLVIIGLLLNVKALLKKEKNRVLAAAGEGYAAGSVEAVAAEKDNLSWWDKFNNLRPSSQEADLDLGHDYDGIRELNNRLPGWWLYGFYFTILFAAIYMWRYHVSHTAPLPAEELKISQAKLDASVGEYLKKKGDAIDETNVTYLSAAADLDAGKAIFEKPGYCSTCHGADGSGLVNGAPGIGPNLTDNYWVAGDGTIKSVFSTVKNGGRPNKGMVAWAAQLSAKEMAQVASYVKSLKPAKAGKEPEPEAKEYKNVVAPAADTTKPATDTLKK